MTSPEQQATPPGGSAPPRDRVAPPSPPRPAGRRRPAPRPGVVERVVEAASRGGDLPSTLRRVVAAMRRAGQRGACIALINERSELYLAAWDGDVDESVRNLRLPLGTGMMGQVAAEGRPIVIADLDAPDDVAPANRAIGTNQLTRCAIAVPIWFDGVVIGVLEMGGSRPGQFGRDDVTLLEQVAAAVAEAVRRVEPDAFAAEVLKHRVRELTFLQDAAARLAGSPDVEAVATTAVAAALDGLSAGGVALLRLDGRGCVPVAVAGAAAADVGAVSVPDLDIEGGLAALRTAPARADGPAVRRLLPGTGPAAAAAVRARGETTALLLVGAGDERGLDPAQLRLLEGIAHLVGPALANAEHHERQRLAARLDPATGLLNRVEFERILAQTVGTHFAMLAVDIDGLRLVNDVSGHEAGDVTLRHVAAALAQAAPPGAVVSRTGGDEFTVLLRGDAAAEAAAVAETMRRSMHGVAVPHGPARISVGCATDATAVDPWGVWDEALAALRRAKRWGRDRVESAIAAWPHEPSPRWDAVLGTVLASHAIRAVYQPIVHLGTGALAGYEALARPYDADDDAEVGGLFGAAQAAGMSRDLDWLCRRAAVQDAAPVPAGTPIFINVGVFTLLDPLHGVDQMLLLLRWARRSPADIVLEITEREVVSDVPRLREVLAEYRDHGFRFAIDDVGDGHSTLEVLAASRPEFVKLAQSMVENADDVGARAAIEAVLAFASSSGGVVVAEGIDTPTRAAMMRSLGVHLGQGFALGRPVSMVAGSLPRAGLG